ncbi:type II toxin-antitoxin system RelE/ParE family toxin [Acetobacter okinawensis]
MLSEKHSVASSVQNEGGSGRRVVVLHVFVKKTQKTPK